MSKQVQNIIVDFNKEILDKIQEITTDLSNLYLNIENIIDNIKIDNTKDIKLDLIKYKYSIEKVINKLGDS